MSWASSMHGRWIVDYEERMDPVRMRRDRVQRLQEQMKKHGLGALLVYHPSNIQYATGTRHERYFTVQRFYRYALVPRDRDPILFEFVGVEYQNRMAFAPWLKDGETLRRSIIWQYSGPAQEYQAAKWAGDIKETLKQAHVSDLPVGLDRMDLTMLKALKDQNIEYVDGWPAIWGATNTKTKDELECMKWTAAINDAAFLRAKEVMKPGVTEYEVAGAIANVLYSLGCEGIECIVVASGGHTNPYLREITDKMIRYGDLVILDIDPTGPSGYVSDFARTFLVREKGTERQRELYKECYDQLQAMLKPIRAGVTTSDIARAMPEELEEAGKMETTGLLHYGHGIGINLYETPSISRAFSSKYPMKIEKNMTLAIETYAGKPGEREGVRLEENIVVTDSGYELLNLCPHEDKLL